MRIDRLGAVAQLLPLMREGRPQGRPPAAGDTLRLTLGQVARDSVIATTPEGLALRLSGLGAFGRGLAAGDVMLVRVANTWPRLELELFELPQRGSAEDSPSSSNAMQPDQLAQRRLSWRPPDPAALAHSWRALVLGHVNSPAAARHIHREADVLTIHAAAQEQALAGVTSREPTASAATSPHRWLYPAYAWGGLHVMLRVVDAQFRRAPRRPRRVPLALRLEAKVPGLGPIGVQVQLAGGSMQVIFFVEQDDHAEQVVREMLPTLIRLLSQAGLCLAQCGIVRCPPLPGSSRQWPLHLDPPSSELPQQLFLAAAQVAVALSRFMPRAGFEQVAR